MINEKFLKPYQAQEVEDKIYQEWENNNLFSPDLIEEKEKIFSMVLPPPNVTGVLHIGHALTISIEDILTRFYRLNGFKALWIPGADHAAIATQSKVEKEIYKKEGKNRFDLGKEEFLNRVKDFAEESKKTIIKQTKKLGASVDWERFAFTLDEKRTKAVYTAFKKMFDAGLIYQGYRIVNWDPKGKTTISDDEVIYREEKTKLYTFKYSLDFPIAISTTRPETKIGDVAVAVHPEDKRYQKFIGKEYKLIFIDIPLKIKIIADKSVDPNFGTGAVGITPAHSITDWEIALRHNLEPIQVINEEAKICVRGSILENKKIKEAREYIVNWLKEKKLLEKEEEIIHNIALAERTEGIIEPLLKLQWFIDVNKEFLIENKEKTTLKKLLIKVVKNNEIEIIPDFFKKTYFHWIENLRDWCISRQIWYGHQIPVFYCQNKECQKSIVSIEKISKCPFCHSNVIQDEDTLDTWFSSALWPLSTLGWPEETQDMKNYFPLSVMETGYDILFFWVARMILMSEFLVNKIPFKKVYLHGLIRDISGQKMSKSKGNAIDPLLMIEKYGADALRISLISGISAGTDIKINEDKIKGYKFFVNKIWNISRFILTYSEDILEKINLENFEEKITEEEDKNILEEFKNLTKEVKTYFENFKFHLASEKLYSYTWHYLADILIEKSKDIQKKGKEEEIISRKHLLVTILRNLLIILHPIIPFVTEEIWKEIPNNFKSSKYLILEKWPF